MIKAPYHTDTFEEAFDQEHGDMELTTDFDFVSEEISCARCCGYPSNQLALDHIYYWLCDACRDLFTKSVDYYKVEK